MRMLRDLSIAIPDACRIAMASCQDHPGTPAREGNSRK